MQLAIAPAATRSFAASDDSCIGWSKEERETQFADFA
jgi:hypothetical protein